ncbi:hypothetical protein FC83_GL002868 [Agrilactobacillus composti DSM 18527 = JCM 14202]|uniref:Uncharacterized protein n=1 Tax=Agrilactobacillus composti DSM 18527 = JCM 14202 TaxID=1423734 RepID=X0PS61_9LACO|nr:hypothetical protein FC83_GL002868 [Agrilactobacillus composti DSM 18527 = JCM 14202]GAF40727.1 hypothetical protein JCM14202_2633 [Agrilactobacillus composti DSM 18527 = JCM 14202]
MVVGANQAALGDELRRFNFKMTKCSGLKPLNIGWYRVKDVPIADGNRAFCF